MADKTLDQLTALTSADATDLLAVYDVSASVLKKMTWDTFTGAVASTIGGTYLTISSNLSDLASPSAARSNMGLGTAATLASSAVFQVANNLSEVANAATARTNIGAAASNAPTITGGMTFSGSTKNNVQAVSSTSIDLSVAEFFTKSISANTTFTFDNATASKGQFFILELTISSGADPTWPASVDWSGGSAPDLGNGKHVLGFVTFNGGTDWTGLIGAVNVS